MDEKETCPRDGFGKILQGQVSEDDQRTISYGPYVHYDGLFYWNIFLELKKILKQTENQENESPVLEPISEETIRRDFGRSTGLTDRTNQLANRPANQNAHKSKPRQTNFSYGFKFLGGIKCIFFKILTQRRPNSIESVASPTNEPITWPKLDPQLCSAIIQPFFKLLKNRKIKELLTYDRCW